MLSYTKMLAVAIVVVVCTLPFAGAQTIPSHRITDWTSPGCRSLVESAEVRWITDYGADPTGVNASDEAFQEAIADIPKPGRLYFPAGTYLFKNTLVLPDSITLEGEHDAEGGGPQSLLYLQPGENKHGIRIQGSEVKTGIYVTDSLLQGQTYLRVSEPEGFSAGDILRLIANDDSILVYNSWAYQSTGQIVEVTSKSNDTLFFDKPLRRSYSAGQPPEIAIVKPRSHVIIRCLKLERVDATLNQTANIALIHARHCEISGVESVFCNFAHIDLRFSSRITIKYSHFEEGHDFGSSGKAYGVMLQSGSADCLVYANTFRRLRHSMILQSGANGNVIAYNYSTDPHWTGVILPSNAAGDLVLHGNWPYMNLCEGNVVQNIVIDNSHHKNGPYNTFFRNRAELYGLFMNNSPASDSQNFMGNQVTNTSSPLLGLYILQGQGHYSHGNMIKGQLLPAGTGEPTLASMMGYSFPTFYLYIGTTPPLQAGNWNLSLPLTESAWRYAHAQASPATCTEPEYDASTSVDAIADGHVDIFPNPTSDIFNLRVDDRFIGCAWQLWRSNGVLVREGILRENLTLLNVTGLPSGIYFLNILGCPASQPAYWRMYYSLIINR